MADDSLSSSSPSGHPRVGLDVKAMIAKLEAFDFKVVADLFTLVNNDPEKETELVDLFARYYEKVHKSQEFLCWAIEWEVSKTEHPSTLFRLESVATGLLFRHFFSDDGMYCLETTVCPLIERVASSVQSSKTDLSKDPDYLFKQTKMFLHELETSCSLFPLDIRQAFCTLSEQVHRRFPDTKNALAVVLFLRFLCPTILQPASFGITEEPLSMDVVKVLLPIARLLQSIANEQAENKILEAIYTDKVIAFIKDNIETVRNFCNHLTNEQEIAAIRRMTKKTEYRPDEKELAIQNVMEYISGPEFPMPSLEMSGSSRTLPALVKKRKVYTLDDKVTKLENILDYVKINVVFLFQDLEHPSYITMMDEASKIRAELDKLGVKQLVITGGTTKAANHWFDNCKFKGEVLIDTSGKLNQLFSLQKRKSTKANLYAGKMLKLRKKFAVSNEATDGLAWATQQNLSSSSNGVPHENSSSEKQASSGKLQNDSKQSGGPAMERTASLSANSSNLLKGFREIQLQKQREREENSGSSSSTPAASPVLSKKEEKEKEKREKEREKEREREKNEREKEREREKNEPKLVKIFVLFGEKISFESKFEGQPQDLLNLLQACGARQETIETARKRLKKKKKISFFTLRRNSVKLFSSSLKESKDKES